MLHPFSSCILHKCGSFSETGNLLQAKKNNKKEEKSNLNDQFGAYGFIRAAEKYHKQDEFRCWLSEHKNVDYGMLPERERNDLWETFVEDFNTCTLPHKKYYDLRAWEVADHNKKAQKHSSKLKKEVWCQQTSCSCVQYGCSLFRVIHPCVV